MFKRLQIIVNPAAGRDKPVLSIFNTAFQETGIDWDVSITKEAGDAEKLARAAVAAGVDAVGVYGGDGTIMEVAAGLQGSEIPLAIFPGGTANAVALALGVPTDLAEACALVCAESPTIRVLDLGQVGERYFMVAVGIGLAGALAEDADREAKDQLGPLAYARATLQALSKSEVATYHLTIDGEEKTSPGVTCIVANSGNFGIPGLSLAASIDMADGLLDVIVIRDTDLASLAAMASSIVRQDDSTAPYAQWQGREISITVEPPQPVQADGEVLDPGPIDIRVVPKAVRVIVPSPAGAAT